MQLKPGDEKQYWISYKYCDEIWSRAYYPAEAEKIRDHPEITILNVHEVITHEDGKVEFRPIEKLDDL